MKERISLSFTPKSIKGDYYLSIFNQFVTFNPSMFSIKKVGRTWSVRNWKKQHINEISSAGYEDSLSVSEVGNFFSVTQIKSLSPYCRVSIVQNDLQTDNQIIEEFINHKGFTAAYVYDAIYETVQSTEYEGNISGLGYSLESIKDTPFTIDPATGDKEYDISYNPGRSILIGHTEIMAAWKMWFGETFFNLVPKARILAFTEAHEIRTLENGQLYVQLFEKIEESEQPQNMLKQQAWLDWIGIEELERKYPY